MLHQVKRILLSQSKVALVDDRDFEWLSQWKWHAHCGPSGKWYALRWDGPKGRRVLRRMHREIAAICGMREVDHKDLDGLNNQRHNLRPCSHSQNAANRAAYKINTSGFKGVFWHPKNRTWFAQIRVNKRAKYLGCFEDKVQAAKAYDNAALKYFGNFARLNFPPHV